MKTKRLILSLLVALMSVTGAMAQNNVIRYTATNDLVGVFSSLGEVMSSVYDPNTHEGVVTFTNDITTIPFHSFYLQSSLISIDLPASITSIEWYAFHNCTSLTSVNLPESLTSIGEGAFFGCTSLASVSIPANVTYFGGIAFQFCNSLKTVTINSQQTLNATGYWTDDGSIVQRGQGYIIDPFGDQVEEYILNGNITIIPDWKFFRCSITNITLPETLTEIKNNAFARSSLTSITIPASVTSIGTYSFKECPLQSITVNATTPPTLLDNCFDEVDNSIPVYVPEGTVDTYKAAGGWKDFTNYQVLQTAKDEAIMELNEAFGGHSAQSIVDMLNAYISQINAATSKAEVDSIYAEAINALPLAIAKLECIDAVKASAEGVVAENLQALIDGYVARINAATTVQAAEAVRDEAIAAFQLMKDKQPMIDALESKKEGVQSEAILNKIQSYIDYISNPSTTLDQATTKYNEALPKLGDLLEGYREGVENAYSAPTEPGMRMKVTKKDGKVYEFQVTDVQSTKYYRATE